MRRIIQIVTAISPGDAVGNNIQALDYMLRDEGFDTEIYAEYIDSRLKGRGIQHISKLSALSEDDIILYHACIATDLNIRFTEYGGKKVMIYHNITPPVFFEKYSPRIAATCRIGENQIRSIAAKVDFCIADSDYNMKQLIAMGYRCPIEVCPILIPFEDYRKAPETSVLNKYQNKDWTNLLFVGRIAPNKGYQDIIAAFAVYHNLYNPQSRLFLVGNPSGMDEYFVEIKQYIKKLDIQEFVIFSGHVSFSEIISYYQLADIFICMSAHEGFCVPLVEAMEYNIPIVAYDSSAISDTLGSGGILLDSTNPYVAADVIDNILHNELLKDYIRRGQQHQLDRFQYEVVKKRFLGILKKIINI